MMLMLEAIQGPLQAWMGYGRIEFFDGFACLKLTFNSVVSLILQRVCECVSFAGNICSSRSKRYGKVLDWFQTFVACWLYGSFLE